LESTKKQNLILGAIAIAIMIAIGWALLRGPSDEPATESAAMKSASVLSPDLFTDEKTRAAYQVAKDIPEVLEQLPCFCGCMISFGHQSNLFCFKDRHGDGCLMCQDIALQAKQLHAQGMSMAQIQNSIKTRYARFQP
jgi:hypothetical protein